MSKILIPAFVTFALLSGCCLRLGESTRFGVNCCGKMDSENAVVDEKKEDDGTVAAQAISANDYSNETIIGISIAAALVGTLVWKSYKQLKGKCHSDAGEKQV